ncbi:MAG: VWA domain-containing protein [Candidatus Acidiferrales bacterium]
MATLLLAGPAPAQQPAPQNAGPPPPAEPRHDLPAAVLRVTTRLVLVDVVVTDKDGRPVTGLTRDDFTLFEDGAPQTISTFVFESPAGRAGDPHTPPPLPENVYTNRPEYRMPPGPLTLLLLDALNTPLVDQSFARVKMLEYLSTQLLPDQRTAILALTTDLLLLQDFTTDPALLRAALDKYSPQSSVALAREQRSLEVPGAVAALLLEMRPETLEAIERFETERSAQALDSRVTTTVSALRVIARAVAGYPGRKNLVWVSTAFPFSFTPENDNNYDLLRFYSDDIRRVAGVLSDAQVAVYPVDARGLVGSIGAQLPTAAESGRTTGDVVSLGRDAGAEMDVRATSLLDTQQTMKQIAEATGGRAFINRNDIDRAVNLAVEDGSTYYTLGFYSKDENWDNKFRRLRVAVNRSGLALNHRRGYYAVNPVEALQERKKSTLTGEDDKALRQVQLRAALSNPLPATAVTFRVGVLPRPARVEFRFMVDVQTISLTQAEGTKHYDLDILAVAFDSAGKAVTSSYHTVETTIEPEQYERLKQVGLPYAMELQLPPGRYHLRMVVRDNRTGLVGTADVPVTLEEPKS